MHLALAACSLALALGGDEARLWARYDRAAIATGELWRLVAAHLVHLGWGHWWPNVAALFVIGALFEDLLSPLEWLIVTVVCALAIDAGLYVFDADVQWYVGLSGVLHGFVACGAFLLLRERSKIGAVLAIGIAIKLVFEQTVGPVPFTAASVGGPVIVAAHLYGVVAGVATALCFSVVRARRSRL